MKITLLVVGKTTDKHLETLISDYCGRLKHYIPFDTQVIGDVVKGKVSMDLQKKQEGDLILKAVGTSATVILLDERGEQYRSVDFATYVQKQMSAGRDVIFVVGGPYGFSKEVYDRANGLISLSKMTFSHQMIRLLFVEQLYRACTIIKHEPYHHE
ncbi:MAG: 23S rRNA (pseudouridine(1915)-N(3))-methyltransferase RlmH [Paludibacteraceae bacterium]|nr:23S rRNA (pseudouridine(1915)-N(3))-methyltransferase RlmH [Paludibacteraceae bacterium]